LDSLESFATVVKQERILRMMTQEELAARSEVSLAVVQAAEAAAGGLNLGQARKLLRALDVEPVVMPAEFVSGGQL
jgi:ribosome-binding protein aMBF1 (putative translation factor)